LINEKVVVSEKVVGGQDHSAVRCPRSARSPAIVDISRQQRWFLLAMMSLAALAASSLLLLSNVYSSPARLLGKAYSEHRTLELRIGRTPHSPMRVQRGQENSRMDRPQSLLEAEAAIARGLRKSPEDSSLLTARGQANLLEWSYEAAITDMQEALDTQPKSPLVQSGLATAYFERAEAEDRFEDYGNAFELQSRALQQSPDDPVILFNRAITAARLYLYKQCIEDWHRYLALDPSGDWSEEARQHLVEVQEIVDAHDKRTKSPLLTPTEFVHAVDASDPKTWDAVEPRIEEYLSVAITDWLPAAFPVDESARPSQEAKGALGVLALILKNNHGDAWLKDLLADSSQPHFNAALGALNHAAKNNRVIGNYQQGLNDARRAAGMFSRLSNQAGAVRAQLEEIYSLHLSDAAPQCLHLVSQLLNQANIGSYSLIQTQLRLEGFNCSAMEGQFDLSNVFANSARQIALEHDYPGLALAALAFVSRSDGLKGNSEDSWRRCEEGLRGYWSSNLSAQRAYPLYVIADVLSKSERLWHLDYVIGVQVLSLLPAAQNPLMQAEEYLNLADAAEMAGDPTAANANLPIAKHLVDSAPQSDTTENYRLDIQIHEAWVEGKTREPEAAVARLVALSPRVSMIRNQIVSAHFYHVLGNMEASAGHLQAAADVFRSGLLLSEQQRSALKSESERSTWSLHAEEPYRDLIEAKVRAQDAFGALQVLQLYRGASLRPPDLIGRTDDLEAKLSAEKDLINLALPSFDKRSVLAYELLSDGLAIWVYDSRGVRVRLVEKDPNYVLMLAIRLKEICATPNSSISDVRTIARELYRILIEPVEDQIHNQPSLIIEADEALSVVPFQVLVGPDGHYLADEHSILYSPGLRYLARLSDETQPVSSETKTLIVASAAGRNDLGLHPLPDALAEAQSVARHFRRPTVLSEQRMAVGSLLAQLRRTTLFHFAGHAGTTGGRTGLLLSSPDPNHETVVFDSSALEGEKLPALKLAVLSACSTENLRRSRGLDSHNLAKALLSAGVHHVVATRWDVDSAASLALMQRFYDLLLSGYSVTGALNQAEAALRLEFNHPYYWAAFDTFGQN
jgi:CHAT domain-containing protein